MLDAFLLMEIREMTEHGLETGFQMVFQPMTEHLVIKKSSKNHENNLQKV
jgi:hypothetical protein